MKLYQGDCLKVMRSFPENSVDAVVTDPPYGLSFMGKKWDYDVPSEEIWRECLRVLKPGGYLLSFAGTRTQHRMAVRIEDAGFEIRDMIAWIYGSGFPKSLNIGKAVDKLQGNEREFVGVDKSAVRINSEENHINGQVGNFGLKGEGTGVVTKGTSEWEGWGTALKPAFEPITVARKPIEGTVAENCLKWGVGGLNIDVCRVGFQNEADRKESVDKNQHEDFNSNGGIRVPTKGIYHGDNRPPENYNPTLGRFPANLITDGSDEVVSRFPNTKGFKGAVRKTSVSGGTVGWDPEGVGSVVPGYGDDGSAARFFYCAKASKAERNRGCEGLEKGNRHETVKPLALMEYLIKLVSKEGHTILDPFTGSGSTLLAAKNLKRDFIGIELSPEYIPIIEARVGIKAEVFDAGSAVISEAKPIPTPKKSGELSKCCNAQIKKGYCEMCCELV